MKPLRPYSLSKRGSFSCSALVNQAAVPNPARFELFDYKSKPGESIPDSGCTQVFLPCDTPAISLSAVEYIVPSRSTRSNGLSPRWAVLFVGESLKMPLISFINQLVR